MDRISPLPDELLLKILSFLPTTTHVDTTVLSKRWQFLWMMVPKLIYDDSYENIKYKWFRIFVYRSLLLHEAPAIESLHLKLGNKSRVKDIELWTRTAVKRSLRELIIEIDNSSSEDRLELTMSSLYAGCRMLVTLKLNNVILVDDSSSISFPSLKSLSLSSVEYPGNAFVERLLSNCHVLEKLYVEQCSDDNVTIFTVRVPSLKSFDLLSLRGRDSEHGDGFVIDAPCMKYLEILGQSGENCVIENNMPNIVRAKVSCFCKPSKILRSITSVKALDLCLTTSKNAYPVGSVFHALVHLNICTCDGKWLNLLMRMLGDSPNLRALKLEQCHDISDDEPRPSWREPSSVPECVKSSLETLEWVKYEGTEEEKEVATFILRNGKCLKIVTIIPHESEESDNKLEMIKELALLPRRSRTCQLVFD